MSIVEFLQFDNLQTVETPKLKELDLGIDKVHYSGNYPTVFFKEVKQFDNDTLKEIALIHHKLWNYKKVMFLYVTTLTEIRIYNCNSKPIELKQNDDIQEILKTHEIAQSSKSDKEKLNQLLEIFSASAIDSGSIWTRDNDYIKKIDLDKQIDKFLVTSLEKTAKELEEQGLDLDIVHSFIMRSLFVMYLEDKGATPESFYEKEKHNAHSYFDLLDDKEATYSFFKKIKDNFNGNVFPVSHKEYKDVNLNHLTLIKKCFTNGDIYCETLFTDWRIFKFDIIQIELLSEIYEKFLGKIQKETGSYYTPPALVELILNEVLPVKNGEKEYNLKILDPTCGSGIFLVEAYNRIVQRWINSYPNDVLDFKILKKLMTDSIYGVELNPKSIKVASFSLYLALLDFLNPKNLWYLDGEKFPYLINDEEDKDIEVQGYNLFRADTIEENPKFEQEYDLIIGNPPYGKTKIPNNIKNYCKKYNFSQEFVIPFIHKSTLLAPKGKIALLATTKLLTNTSGTSQNFRKWLFNDNYVEKVYNLSILRKTLKAFGGSLFSSAVVPATIFFFQKEAPQKVSKNIEYWAPKTYIKTNIAEGVIIDSTDVKYLPRDECQKPNTKIWKIAQWGGLNDFILISNLVMLNKLDRYIDKEEYGGGFQRKKNGTENLDIKKIPFIDTKKLDLYYTKKSQTEEIEDMFFERFGTEKAYKAPHLLIKEGVKKVTVNQKKDYRIVSSFVDYNCSFYKGIIGIHHTDKTVLKALVTYFNSTFTKYFMFLTSASWGIERDVIKSNELVIPNFFENNETVDNLANYFDEIQQLNNEHYLLNVDISSYENNIDNEVFKFLKLSKNEIISINDNIKYTIDLFYKGYESIAVQPIDNNAPETIQYSNKLCSELNETLEDSELKVVPSVYKTSYYSPLCLVVIQFIEKENPRNEATILETDSEFKQILSKLNEYTLNEYSKGIYVQKNLTYYDDDKIYIIKPNQKRFWTQSQAIEDAQNITLEIMSMY